MRLPRLLLLALGAASAAGCVTYERGTFAAVSTAPVPLDAEVVARDVESRVCQDPFHQPLKRAVEEALRSAPDANALTGVRYRFDRLCMVVHGTAVRVP